MPALGWAHRRHYDLRASFITLALEDGADPDIIESRVTHTKKARSAFDGYNRGLQWAKTCAEVTKLKITRKECASAPKLAGSADARPLLATASAVVENDNEMFVEAAGVEAKRTPRGSARFRQSRRGTGRAGRLSGNDGDNACSKPCYRCAFDGNRRCEPGPSARGRGARGRSRAGSIDRPGHARGPVLRAAAGGQVERSRAFGKAPYLGALGVVWDAATVDSSPRNQR